jgi:hypothetical protein
MRLGTWQTTPLPKSTRGFFQDPLFRPFFWDPHYPRVFDVILSSGVPAMAWLRRWKSRGKT